MCCSDHKPRHAMSMRQRLTTIIATTLLAFNIGAQDLGVIGPVYPIAEPSLLEVILTKLRHAESTGVLGQLQRDAQTRIRRGIEQPESITNVSKTTKPRTHYYDPSLVIPYAISDAEEIGRAHV